ncbi:peptide ABC transporter substrate-binding protein [Gammaproteobacteria bacterium 50_400_T64]|nr:peptide ABC transporter substrate-binding protein [Gammaproteobacteria bacterium 50_400_T64]
MAPCSLLFKANLSRPRRYLSTLICTLGCLFLVACGNGENNVRTGLQSQTLHWGNGAEPQELDPHIVTGVPEHHIIVGLLEGLVLKDPATLEPTPGMAERWEISDDGKTYTFYIRDDARWSNGDPVTSEDFAWSWWRALQPALGNLYAYMYYPIKNAEAYATGKLDDFSQVGVKAIDALTLEVTLANPTPYFLQLLDHYSMFPVHRATIEKFGEPAERGTRWTRAGNFVGNGPFILTQWDLNRLVMIEKSPTYYDADKVRLHAIRFYPTENVSTEERMFRAGQLHVTGSLPADKIAVYKESNPQALRISPYLGTYFYRINTTVEHLADKRIRRALAMAVDRQQIINTVTKGGQTPAFTFTPPNTLGYTTEAGFVEDIAAAKALLAEAGYPNGEGFPPTEILYNTSEGHRKLAVAIQQMWKKNLNIDITLNNQDWKVYLDSEASGNFQISRAGWIGDYVDPNTFLDMWLTDGGNNRTGWHSDEYDQLINEAAPVAKEREQRYAHFRRAEAILMDAMPIIPIYTYNSTHLVHPNVKGMPSNILDYSLYKQMYLSED